MKRSQGAALAVLALMLLAAAPISQSIASSSSTNYTERLNVDIAGSSAYWYFTFGGINGSNRLAQFESTPGLAWYNVTAMETTSWQSDFAIFGPQGYNVLPVPHSPSQGSFLPSQGLFLTVGSDSFANASAAAGRLNSYLLSTFVSYSNSSGSYTFYSPVSYGQIVPYTLLKMVPSAMGGFASAIKPSSFDKTSSPFVVLEGTKANSTFAHSLVVGSISSGALTSAYKPNILSYSGSNATSLVAANKSTSSSIHIRVLDGLMTSKDKATVANSSSLFTSSYLLSMTPKQKVRSINATVLQQPMELLAQRQVDVGVLQHDDNMTVTLTLTNLSNSSDLYNVTLSDNWFNPAQFKLVAGSTSFSQKQLNESKTSTPGYTLEYIGNATGTVTMPAAEVSFAYYVAQSIYKGRAWTNNITIALGENAPVVYANIAPASSFSVPVGAAQTLYFVVTNVGNRDASNVKADGQSVGILKRDGGSYTVPISQSASGVLDTNITKSYLVTYQDDQGNTFTATTNLLPLEFSHSGMKLGYPLVTASANLAPLKAGSTAVNLTLSFQVKNIGRASLYHFSATVQLPPGLGCGKVSKTGISCASGLLTLSLPSMVASGSNATTMNVNVTTPENFLISPLSYSYTTGSLNFTGMSNAVAVPTGLVLTKTFTPTLLFTGVTSTVTLVAVNSGPFRIYNASVTSTNDSFDKLPASDVNVVTNHTITPLKNLTQTYAVNATATYGNRLSSVVSATVYFGGTKYVLEGFGPYVSVYRPLSGNITASPATPTEGKGFTLTLVITNPSAVNVTSVLFTLPVPSGITVSQVSGGSVTGGELTVTAASLAAHGSLTVTATAVAGTGATYSLSASKLTFVYDGRTMKGVTPTHSITVNENTTTRYILPLVIAVVVLLGAAFYMRRMAAPSAPASPK